MMIFTSTDKSEIAFVLQPKDRIYDVANSYETAIALGAHVFFVTTGSSSVDNFIKRISGAQQITAVPKHYIQS